MKSLEIMAHGTSSSDDATKIEKEGFKAKEGRATVSGDLIFAFDWATHPEKRKGSQSEAKIHEGEKGRIIIMSVPEDKLINYATHTSIEVDDDLKEITGYSSKYESGRRQLAIFGEDDVINRRKEIEEAKKELRKIKDEFQDFLDENNVKINLDNIKSNEDKDNSRKKLAESVKLLPISKQLEIFQMTEEFEKRMVDKRKDAEPAINIEKDNILMNISPSKELGEKLEELKFKIENLDRIDLQIFTEEISKIIINNKENFVIPGLDVKDVVLYLLTKTIETEVVSMVRSRALDVKRVNGFKIYNRGNDEIKEKEINKSELKLTLEKALSIVESKNFDIGIENLNRYLKLNIKKLLEELNK